ncbi:hypothetical protein [Paenibacillus sacheonensis]|uniref:Uncharacterized protein n=1 Tax=Paenibacillus sacheonensis TaxID=742054 RepID=A0A7X4YPQ2_9BACL|nr:hypothetical protein [Paenibacillus sacheonensis]MBM7564762.1 hypothetical protein [Paenibacillus sacheonensis]NBC69314.1 hypothetical protein [Paenibacillus sacheonensis]
MKYKTIIFIVPVLVSVELLIGEKSGPAFAQAGTGLRSDETDFTVPSPAIPL